VSVEVTGLDETRTSLEAMAARLRDLRPVMAVVAADTMTLIDDSFAGSRAPDGSPWAPLAESTLRQRRGTTATTLVDTGRLRSSMFARGQATGIEFGTNVSYAAPHQTGARRMPRRAFLPIDGSGPYTLTATGPAGTHWQRARESIRRYIRTGEVT
jgi:phage virion morphogenesis protein